MSFQTELLADPTLFPQQLDFLRRATLFVRHQREDYRRASFLDGRILTQQSQGLWVNFDDVTAALAGAVCARPPHFIFHAGHVGSTLISRLLDDVEGVFSLREPLTLRTLGEAQDALGTPESLLSPSLFQSLVTGQVLLWSRGYADTRAVIVKATSTAIRLAPALLETAAQARAICVNVPLEPYLATLLAGPNSLLDLRGHGAERMRRLRLFGAKSKTPLHAMSVGELAGLAWLVESATQARLANRFSSRILQVDFEVFLGDVADGLGDVCAHFNLDVTPSFLTLANNSPAMRSYAKAPDAPYSPETRAALLNEARRLRLEEIYKGRRWVDETLQDTPILTPPFLDTLISGHSSGESGSAG